MPTNPPARPFARHHAILMLPCVQVLTGENSFDTDILAGFAVLQSGNTVQGNIAAGSDCVGFKVAGDDCTLGRARAQFASNAAHTCLVGLVLDANTAGSRCTQAAGFSAYLTWDFGLVTLKVGGQVGK